MKSECQFCKRKAVLQCVLYFIIVNSLQVARRLPLYGGIASHHAGCCGQVQRGICG